jgi:hypothetical protein
MLSKCLALRRSRWLRTAPTPKAVLKQPLTDLEPVEDARVHGLQRSRSRPSSAPTRSAKNCCPRYSTPYQALVFFQVHKGGDFVGRFNQFEINRLREQAKMASAIFSPSILSSQRISMLQEQINNWLEVRIHRPDFGTEFDQLLFVHCVSSLSMLFMSSAGASKSASSFQTS